VIAGPRHFAALASRLRWEPAELELTADGGAWKAMPPAPRARLAVLLAGFCVAECSVAEELAPFASAAGDPAMAAVFLAQRADELRHAVLFDRIAASVLGLPGDGHDDRRGAARELAPPALVELFEGRLAGASAALARGHADLAGCIALYHMILEGVVLIAGQRAVLHELSDGRLPAVRAGVELVERDERWHVGFGLRCLLDLRPEPKLLRTLIDEGERAAASWGEVVSRSIRSQVVAGHRRRLAALGLAPPSRVAHVVAVG
jgi:ribonucleoside-diphosphate reductase beta chain